MPPSYEGKNVLVTGGAGFIGSELVVELRKHGADVTVLDDFSFGDLQNIRKLKVKVICGDLREEEAVVKATKGQNIIFHLAARPFIPLCYQRPKEFFAVNADGTLNLMLATLNENPEMIVHVSSSEVYGTAQYVPMDENHPVNPHSTYAVSKLAADRICFSLYKEHGMPITIIRPFNTYGPRETHPYIVPTVISQLVRSNKLVLGNLESSRDFTYVADTVRALLIAGQCKQAVGEVINVGSGKDVKIRDLVYLIARLMGKKKIEISQDKSKLRPFDVDRLCANYDKANRILKWEPTISLEDGLKETIDWYLTKGAEWPWERNPFYIELLKLSSS